MRDVREAYKPEYSWPPTEQQWEELFGKKEPSPPALTFRDEDQPFGWPEIDA